MTFRVLHAPLHGPSAARNPKRLIAGLRQLAPDTIGLTEAYARPVRETLRTASGYRYVMEAGGIDPRRGQYDVPILVKDGLRSLGSGQLHACDASTPSRIAPERWYTWSTIVTPLGPVCHIALHLHAVIQADDGGYNDSPRAAVTKDALIVLDNLLNFATSLGWRAVVTGDPNFRDKRPVAMAPHRILRAHGLRVDAHGLDLIAHDPALGLEVTPVKAPPGVTNHPWLLATSTRG